MSRASERLREFHEAFDVEHDIYRETAQARMTLHTEEHVELVKALRDLVFMPGNPEAREAVARELADVMVIAYGTADLLDVDLDVAFEAVMDANMAKLPTCPDCDRGGLLGDTCPMCNGTGKGQPLRREDGKVMRPESWTPPDMSGAIR